MITLPTLCIRGWLSYLCRMQEAEVGGNAVPEPFDVRTEHAVEAGKLIDIPLPQYLESSGDSKSSGECTDTQADRQTCG